MKGMSESDFNFLVAEWRDRMMVASERGKQDIADVYCRVSKELADAVRAKKTDCASNTD